MGDQFLLSQRANIGKREFIHLSTWEEGQSIFTVVGAIVTTSAAVLARANVAWNARSMNSNR